jgi:hypothetical protein
VQFRKAEGMTLEELNSLADFYCIMSISNGVTFAWDFCIGVLIDLE